MQALMLAAGMGKRLGKFTNDNTKCMVEVAGKKLIDRAIEAVKLAGINKFALVVGYEGQKLIDYINSKYSNCGIEFSFINNKDYATSNNIYSFYMAKSIVESEDTILLESDLIYDVSLIKKIVEHPAKDVVTVAKYQSWMDGTLVMIDDNNNITQFVDKNDMKYEIIDQYYKTVNIYKFSKEFCKNIYIPFLEAYMKAYGLNSYYETPLKVIAHVAKTPLVAYEVGDLPWYEIDDEQDLDISEVMFSSGKKKYDNIISKFGGYWRYSKMLDFCYLVNPYFPPKTMLDKIKQEMPILLTSYPSGLNMQNMNAERIFKVNQENILVGNGAAELINALGLTLTGKVAVGLPTFNEYVRCFRNCELVKIDNSQWDYSHNLQYLKEITREVDALMIVNPDNPSGYTLSQEEIEELLDEANKNSCKIIVDESFIDFANSDKRYTLLSNEILSRFTNLIVVKSISKSYGVPGLRLGILASYDKILLKKIRDLMQVWNINSFAEYYLQIYNLYEKTYLSSCDKIASERTRMIKELHKIDGIKVYDSEANYVMIDLKNVSSYDFCVKMLDRYNILIKDLSSKNYFYGKNFVRIAIRSKEENDILIKAAREELSKNIK